MRNAFQCFAGTKRNSGYSKKKVYAIPLMPDEHLSVCAGPQLERVLINAQMSGLGGEAETLCSTRVLPVLTLKRHARLWIAAAQNER
jgi:hypothetical protein